MRKNGKCIVDSCTEDHPPWVCKAFQELPVQRRKELITQTGQCFRYLAAGHKSRYCDATMWCQWMHKQQTQQLLAGAQTYTTTNTVTPATFDQKHHHSARASSLIQELTPDQDLPVKSIMAIKLRVLTQ